MKANTTLASRMANQLATAKAMMQAKANGATATADDESRMSPEFWNRVDTLELTEEEARQYLALSEKHPAHGMDIAPDFTARCIREDYVVDKRKGDGVTKLLFAEGKEEPTIKRIMEHALEGKVKLVGAVEIEGVSRMAYFGVNLNGAIYRTGRVANTALAIAKAMKGEPVVLLAEVVPGYEEA